MQQLPVSLVILFIFTTALTLWFVYKATAAKTVLVISILWLAIQGLITYSGFYMYTQSMPPRFLLVLAPPLLTIVTLFALPAGRRFIDSIDMKWMAWLHIVRVPVELVLLWLFIYKQVPQLVTFEGRNWDMLSGLSAPVIAYFGYQRHSIGRWALLAWNFVCLGLLVNVVSIAILSAPLPFQQFAFDMPNVAILQFPFVWLPAFIVPSVLFAHLVAIRKLLIKQ